MGVGGEKMPGIDTKSRKTAKVAHFIAIFARFAQIFGPDGAALSAAKKI